LKINLKTAKFILTSVQTRIYVPLTDDHGGLSGASRVRLNLILTQLWSLLLLHLIQYLPLLIYLVCLLGFRFGLSKEGKTVLVHIWRFTPWCHPSSTSFANWLFQGFSENHLTLFEWF